VLFKLIEGKDFFELNPEALAIKEFGDRTSQQMWVVALVADYESPLRQKSERDRREIAVGIAGYKKEADGKRFDKNGRNVIEGKVPTIELAIAKYREIQYDEDQEMLKAVNSQIQEAMSIMTMDKEEACIVKNEKVAKDGTKSTEEYVDQVQRVKLVKEAINLGKGLEELKKTKQGLIAIIAAKGDTRLDITTYTSADLSPESDSELNTLEQFMASRGAKRDNE
jgi:hypothetical protein